MGRKALADGDEFPPSLLRKGGELLFFDVVADDAAQEAGVEVVASADGAHRPDGCDGICNVNSGVKIHVARGPSVQMNSGQSGAMWRS